MMVSPRLCSRQGSWPWTPISLGFLPNGFSPLGLVDLRLRLFGLVWALRSRFWTSFSECGLLACCCALCPWPVSNLGSALHCLCVGLQLNVEIRLVLFSQSGCVAWMCAPSRLRWSLSASVPAVLDFVSLVVPHMSHWRSQ